MGRYSGGGPDRTRTAAGEVTPGRRPGTSVAPCGHAPRQAWLGNLRIRNHDIVHVEDFFVSGAFGECRDAELESVVDGVGQRERPSCLVQDLATVLPDLNEASLVREEGMRLHVHPS